MIISSPFNSLSSCFQCRLTPYVKLSETSLSLKGAIQIHFLCLAKSSTIPCNINRLYEILWAEIIAAIKADPGSRDTNIRVVNRKDLQIISATWRIKELGVNLLLPFCSALQRTLKQLVPRFNPLKLSDHRALTLFTVGISGQCVLSWCFNYWSRPKIDDVRRESGCPQDNSSNIWSQ